MEKVIQATISYSNGTSDTLFDGVAQRVHDGIRSGKVAPNGILNFDDASIFVAHIKKIEWFFEDERK